LQHASPDLTIPVIDVKDLPSYDGILFGLCTRFGMAAAQMKAVMDATGTLFTSQQQQLSPQVISMLLLFLIVKSVALCTFQGC
jgi:multimeric flavodoxin WrbA